MISKPKETFAKIVYIIETVNYENSCGFISMNYFAQNLFLFMESHFFNNCLYKKLSINKDGCIKNCPCMNKNYGFIGNATLKDIIKKNFTTLWHIKKDDIDVCKDCEFRYMCTDCRAFIKDKNNIYSQPSKCNYNPYIAKWESEEGYITVEEWRKQNKKV